MPSSPLTGMPRVKKKLQMSVSESRHVLKQGSTPRQHGSVKGLVKMGSDCCESRVLLHNVKIPEATTVKTSNPTDFEMS